MPLTRALVVAITSTAVFVAAVPCAADDSLPRRAHTSVALLGGYGFQLDSVLASGVSAHRFGFGTRAGVSLPFGGYVGGSFVAHTGTNVAGARAGETTYVVISHATYLGPEAGFDIELWKLLLRPYVGAGAMLVLGKTAVERVVLSDAALRFYVAPGALVAYPVGELLLGLDLRVPIVPAQSSKTWAPAAFLVIGTTLP